MTFAGLDAQHVAETGSTNSDLLAHVHAAAAAAGTSFTPCLLVADRQTAGRGRHGRRWHAERGASLTFSLAWPFAAGRDLAGLSLAVGVALAEALDPRDGATRRGRLALKWPNDLWLVEPGDDDNDADDPGRKLGGILIETAPFGGGRVAVIGVGLNVQRWAPAEAASGVAWLGELDGAATPASALHRIVGPLVTDLQRFTADGFAAFAEGFAARDLLRGRTVSFARAGGEAAAPIVGTAAGVAASGELLVATATATVPVTSGEVRLHLVRSAAARPC